ncbi:FYN-binding protein 2 [Octodon degus]|uniref:FYN-binding protein 2 n=1 Tax=Octodon degus TaxID=10160 RepID=A0A6P6DEM8_OCTDE|nr:FYN-binding protein 2 [Octodon degus]
MEEEGVRSFKELRAKFQKWDAPPLLGPIKFPASVSQTADIGWAWPTPIVAPGKPCPSYHNWSPARGPGAEANTPQAQRMKWTQRRKIQKSSSSPGLLEKPTASSPRESQVASLPPDVNASNPEVDDEEKGMGASSFQDKLRKWEKVSSQKGVMRLAPLLTSGGTKAFQGPGKQKSTGLLPERPWGNIQPKWAQTLPAQMELAHRKILATSEKVPSLRSGAGRKNQEKPSVASSTDDPCQPAYECELAIPAPANPLDTKQPQLPRTKPLPPIESLGPAPPKPPKPPAVDLQAFQRQQAALTETQAKADGKELLGPPERVEILEANPLDTKQPQLPRTKPLPPIESLGPAPPKPPKPPAVDLQAFQRQQAALTETQAKADGKELLGPPESAEFEEPHNYEATISSLRQSGNSINLCTAEKIAGATYEVEIEELPKPWKSCLPQELCPQEDKYMQGKEPCELGHQESAQEPHARHPAKVDVYEVTPEHLQMTSVHSDGWIMAAAPQETTADNMEAKAWSEDVNLAGPSQDQGGCEKALELTAHPQDLVAFNPRPVSQATYDDVDCLRADISKSDFSSSFTSDSVSEESSEEIYDDVCKTKSNSSQIELDGKEALKRLQQFFRKEKDRFKMKAIKSKENLRAFSVSLPDLQLRSQEVVIYDDVNTIESEANFSPRNFFRTKKKNYLEKNRIREEKLFRQRFQYNKEIAVINRAVVCSSTSRNGMFDLPVTPGEELEVIDTTDQNLVICRNSKGKYGYVLIEHLNFKHHGWSPLEDQDPMGRPVQGVAASRT